ncbi:cytochrome P450 307a1-like [Anopheles stephensi]|uniref:cytochrome P450 307a1-like n=1 Tax=Anopheles stephensi TaxID=30069 RepID=UPI0016587761|nr:cytochrome P450 307a1-like [Anopheles stephensi]XP_035905661.1 cytochrome P450 307a1-like [Anopheles stephensi]
MDRVSVTLLSSSSTAYLMVSCFLLTLLMLLPELKQKVFVRSELLLALRQLITSVALTFKSDEVMEGERSDKQAPGPKNYPIIGALKELNGYEVPYQAFSDFGVRYGPVTALRLGSVNAVVVNGFDNIREVLINKGQHFDSRPNFRRYQLLFSGNKENSLAFCDWSEVQKARRDMLVPHTFPRNYSGRFDELNTIVVDEISQMLGTVQQATTVEIKPLVLAICANAFSQYFGSHRFEVQDKRFQQLVRNFDQIFYEVNQGYAADFLPFLLPLHRQNLRRMDRLAEEIRTIILDTIIGDRYERWGEGSEPRDYVDSLIEHVKAGRGPALEWETALFALEDIVGGHSAVGNFLVKAFGYIVQHPEVQQRIQAEADEVLERHGRQVIELTDRAEMPYTEAVIMEALRLIASPIVPHVANQDSQIGGFAVAKDTLIFLNNYDLSMSPQLWDAPESFRPERFLQHGRVVKPDYFIPFGAGRRSCMGYRMTQLLSFSIIANMLRAYTIAPIDGHDYRVPVGSLAMPEQSYSFSVSARSC